MFIDINDINSWINHWVNILNPDNVEWYFGISEHNECLIDKLKQQNLAVSIDSRQNSYAFFSDPSDVARMESKTFICSKTKKNCGITNNWHNPGNMYWNILLPKLKNAMQGKTMYIIPFSMGNPDTNKNIYGIQITDQPYVCLSMRIMTRIGENILKNMTKFIPCIHTSGKQKNGVIWPCSDEKYITHFPDGIPELTNASYIISYGSSYGGNALLSKKCLALRIASVLGYKENWLAEHCLILKITSPENIVKYYLASFPSSCGKTNLAMCDPCLSIKNEGWKFETIGDDIAWIFPIDGKLYALNPENGFFGVAPGTSFHTNPNAIKSLEKDCLFTNVGIYKNIFGQNDVWWEGLEKPDTFNDDEIIRWNNLDTKNIAHPNSRYTVPITNCPCLAKEYQDLVPISGIIYGGRRKDTIPLVSKANDFLEGIFYGATLSSEETSASVEGKVGNIRFDPMSMKPFIGYNIEDYFSHWINIIKKLDEKPDFYLVNWFRKNENGKFVWNGFGENAIVLKWIFENDKHEKINGFFGQYPKPENLNVSINDWNNLFCDSNEKLFQHILLVENYIKNFDNFPSELLQIYNNLKDYLTCPV